MSLSKCPGMNSAFFKPKDVKLLTCINCGKEIEFWKDDIKLKCRSCGQTNFNPNIGNTCLAWCKSAEKCLGNEDIKEWMERNKNTLFM